MLSFNTYLLLAVDLNGLLSILFILFSLIVYVINQVAAKGQDGPKNQQPRPRPAPPSADPTEDEIEAFLRRASRKREGEPGGRGQQPQRQQAGGGQPFGSQQRPGQRGSQRAGGQGRGAGRPNQGLPSQGLPSQGMPSQSMPSQMPLAPQTPAQGRGGQGRAVQGRVVEGRVVQQPAGQAPSASSSLSEQLEHRSSLSSLAEAGSQFPTFQSSLEQIDEAAEARLHSTFDHALGSLGGGLLSTSDDDRFYGSTITDSSQPDQPQPATSSIADMIRSPGGIRNAIIMQEILRPRSEL